MPSTAEPPSRVHAASLNRLLARLSRAEQAPWLHQETARRMAERLPLIREAPRDWLDWWGHQGGSANAVAQVLPKAARRVVEPTSALLEASRRSQRRPWWSIGARPGDAQAFHLEPEVPAGQAQLLWANMVLHASPDPSATMARWQAALDIDGFLMFSTFGPDTLLELRELYAEEGWAPPHAPFTDMHDIGDALVHAGFADPVMDQEHLVLTWSSPQALLAELRSMGAQLDGSRPPGLRTPRWRDRLLAALARRVDAEGRIRMSFELVYGHAVKVKPRARRGEPVTISVEEVRSSLRKPRAGPDRS